MTLIDFFSICFFSTETRILENSIKIEALIESEYVNLFSFEILHFRLDKLWVLDYTKYTKLIVIYR